MKVKGGAGFVSCGNCLYILAGLDGNETNDCYKYDLSKNEWQTISSDNLRPRSVFGTCTVGKHVIILGGEIEQSEIGHLGAGDFADDLIALNTETLEWTELEQNVKPLARGWTRLAGTGVNSLILFGGLAGNDENPNRLDDTWECKFNF